MVMISNSIILNTMLLIALGDFNLLMTPQYWFSIRPGQILKNKSTKYVLQKV